MSESNFFDKLRQLDNKSSQWMIRHFYILFFEVVLIVIFVFFFVNAMSVVDTNFGHDKTDLIQKMLQANSVNSTLILLLFLFNSFWMLFLFRTVMSMRSSLRSIEFNISKMRQRGKGPL